jgi:hypothetical protein
MDVGMVGVVGWLLGWWKKINNGWKKMGAILIIQGPDFPVTTFFFPGISVL